MLEINALCLQCGIIFVEIFIGGVHSFYEGLSSSN